jgi:hypothetical protein
VRADFQKIAFIAFFAFLMCVTPGSHCLASELIAPTQTLQRKAQEQGRLTVFSEPPRLQVLLDGKNAGNTPLWLRDVKAGWHTVRIKKKETRIYLGPRKALAVGLFKGSFITFPEKKKEQKKPREVEQQATTPPATPNPSAAQRKEELTRWELFVNGSLRHF